jgi:hypothetical protein
MKWSGGGEQVVERDALPERSQAEGAVGVDLDAVFAGEPHSFGEAAVEPPVVFGFLSLRSVLLEDDERPVDVAGPDQQIEIRERPQRRIQFVQVRHRRPFEDQVLDPAGLAEPVIDLKEPELQLDAPQHRSGVVLDDLFATPRGGVVGGDEQWSEESLRGRRVHELATDAGIGGCFDPGCAGQELGGGRGEDVFGVVRHNRHATGDRQP